MGLILVAATLARASEEGEWLRDVLKIPNKGATEWTVVLTTGHFGRDPQLASSTRNFVISLLSEVGSKEDSLVVAAAEMGIWTKSARRPLLELKDLLPTSPAKQSRGGRDLERILFEASELGQGPVIVFSPGDSQEPLGGGDLMGGEVQISGFTRVTKKEVAIPTESGPRKIQLTVTSPSFPFSGDTQRMPLSLLHSSAEIEKSPRAINTKHEDVDWLLPASLGGAIALVIGIAVGFIVSRRKPSQLNVGLQSDDDLDLWKSEAKQLQRRLDIVAQELAASAEQVTADGDQDRVELRQELARREKLISTWDETAIDYLEGLNRIIQSSEVSVEQREFAFQAATQFKKLAQRAGLDEIEPREGDLVLSGQHRVEQIVDHKSIEANRVVDLVEPGYRRGDQVIRQARIVMSGGVE